MQDTNQSEVAHLVRDIEDEYKSGKLGLEGLAEGISQHAFITARMEKMAADIAQIVALAGEEEARDVLMKLR